MKKQIMVIALILILVTFSVIVGYFAYQKSLTANKVNEYLETKDYDQKIQSKETSYNYKDSTHYIEIVYEDEPHNRYVYSYNNYLEEVIVEGYNSSNIEITDKKNGRYIDQ
ncbi:hypothetical protein J416_12477 [Gracilibacillus halophilus YIM-C55.5]|uniref:DUF3139 domain-containing protein n=1 Tax=Gracilibacillus halophilus YIM-C55.5 TaxID=1308866 RepID=N4WNS7_9BACI|nr:DUF3139 domain-containing protein [Gracilibacillus halophilus]ENH96135.1 hypothetical protein J416_12477 [Gracilibacillus halophilus YIM-C55.5]